MNILIVEDETRAANQLQRLLQSCHFHFVLLGVIDTVEDAVRWFENNAKPDLVFMDIQLADGISFEIFQKVTVKAPIIFTTAFDQYAIQAFKVNSIDYLLKPIQQDDLQNALDKFNHSNQTLTFDPSILHNLLGDLQTSPKREGILVKEGKGFVQIKISNILYFYSEDSITFAVTGTKRYVVEETLDIVYQSLEPSDFYKINRSQVVAKTSVERINPYFNHRVKLTITYPRNQEFVVSRTKTPDFKKWMNS